MSTSSFLNQPDSSGGTTSPLSAAPEQKPHHSQPRVRRRNRLITSCLECRRRKLKCDKGQPCANCVRNARQCVFIAPGLDPEAQARLADVKEKMGILERSLEVEIARKSPSKAALSPSPHHPTTLPGQDGFESDQEDDEDTKDLDPTDFATQDAAYYEDDDNDDVVDLGIAMGRVRITERIGGLVRPKFSEELAQGLKELPKVEPSARMPLFDQDPVKWLAPSRDYVAPSSSFFFNPGIEKTALMTHLPSKILVDRLVAHYWIGVHAIAKAVHRPSFERQYRTFWISVNAGVEPRASFQAVVFAALLSSVVSMPKDRVLTEFGVDKQSLVLNFREGTEAALAKANFLRTTKLETLQAFVMYLIPLCRNEISRIHSAMTGALIRLAECMGLHRDPTTYNSSPIEIHVRRLVWYQICFLDLRTCEASGPRPQIRPEDYNTRFPLNISDIELEQAEYGDSNIDIDTDRTHFTDTTITRIRFECYEMHRFLWNERPKLERKHIDGERKVTLTSLLARVQSFKAAMEETYVPMLSMSLPLHVIAAEIYGILSDRLYIMILQRYLSSDRKKMPDRLRQVVLSAATMILERSMTIEQQPALADWSWYMGALHQYHVSLILLNELYAAPQESAMEQRVWKCLDFAFNITSDLTNIEKCRLIMEDLVEKTKIYAGMKRIRAPTNMPQPGPRKHTPGWKAREREAQEEETQTTDLPPTASSATIRDFSLASIGMFPQQQHQQHKHFQPHATKHFGEGVPNVDWGTIDLPASMSSVPQPTSTPEVHKYVYIDQASPSETLIPVNPIVQSGQQHASNASDPEAAIYGMAGGTTGSSPMDALNDIDWSDIEQMFGSAEVGAGNMLIPPFTFPQFSAAALQWPRQDEL